MTKFNASADILEVNRYDFVIEAETKEEAEEKLNSFLETNCPHPNGEVLHNNVACVDRESAMETQEIKSITME